MTLDATQFAHWIKGYQNFYEPIVRAWFEENGYRNLRPMSVSGADLAHAADSLETDRPRWSLSAKARTDYASTLRRRSKLRGGRIQLDMLAEKQGLSAGEFKSWVGYMDRATRKLVKYEFVGDTLGLFMTLTQIMGQEVNEAILVLPQRSEEHETVESNLSEVYGLPVRLPNGHCKPGAGREVVKLPQSITRNRFVEKGQHMQMETAEAGGFMTAAATRIVSWGSTIVGILGIVLALNAALSDEYTGAGACLAASALAFGIIGYTFRRR